MLMVLYLIVLYVKPGLDALNHNKLFVFLSMLLVLHSEAVLDSA